MHLRRPYVLKSTTPDKVLYQIIGNPEVEWYRRSMRLIPGIDLVNDREYQTLQLLRTQRKIMRKKLKWEHILIASIPLNAVIRCKKCKKKFKVDHLKTHLEQPMQDFMDTLSRLIIMEDSVQKIMQQDDTMIGEFWKMYLRFFVKSNTKRTINELQ